MGRIKDISEQKFGFLKVVKYLEYDSNKKAAMWLCICECRQ